MPIILPFRLGVDYFGSPYTYCFPSDIYKISDLTEDDITEAEIVPLINKAISEVNSKLQVRITEEKIALIDNYRQNKIDGSNKTYYVSKSWEYYFGDLDNDGTVDTTDVIVYDYDPTDWSKTTLAPASIDEKGSFTLSSAPEAGHKLTVTYCYSPVSMQTPDERVRWATAELTTALAYLKLTVEELNVDFGRLRVLRSAPQGYTYHYNRFLERIREILGGYLFKKSEGEDAWEE